MSWSRRSNYFGKQLYTLLVFDNHYPTVSSLTMLSFIWTQVLYWQWSFKQKIRVLLFVKDCEYFLVLKGAQVSVCLTRRNSERHLPLDPVWLGSFLQPSLTSPSNQLFVFVMKHISPEYFWIKGYMYHSINSSLISRSCWSYWHSILQIQSNPANSKADQRLWLCE